MLPGSQMGTIQNAVAQKTGHLPAAVGTVLGIATPMVVGQIGKMFKGKPVDQAGLTSLLGEQSKMAMQSSPEAASLAEQYLAPVEEAKGISGFLKKLMGS